MPAASPSPKIIVREHGGQPFYEVKFFFRGRQVKRRIGPAWLERDPGTGGWRRHHKRRVPDGVFDEVRASVRATEIVAECVGAEEDAERAELERRQAGASFREVAHAYLKWLESVQDAKPSTLQGHRCVLAEPGVPYKRGKGTTAGYVMAALGDRPAAQITTREIEDLLVMISERTIGKPDEDAQEPVRKVAPRTVNKYRAVINAVFNYGCRPSTFALPANPAKDADKRREPHPGVLLYYTSEEVEAIARALAAGEHRDPSRLAVTPEVIEAEHAEDLQDAELVRIGYYTGLRMGELRALRWRNIDFADAVIKFDRAISAGVESTTKSGRVRIVPLSDQAASALERVSRREDYTSPNDRVFCNAYGRTLDESALRRRYKRARAAAGVEPLRFHDLRHTFGSQLAARGVDIVKIKEAMGHAQLSTTSRYLHARPATDQARLFTEAFTPATPGPVLAST
ncbi:MAG: site-specific integrase [Solirubrobacteraceae bacterium]